MIVAMLLVFAVPAYSGSAMQIFVCEQDDDTTDEEVDAAKSEPPQDTRARMRGEFIKLARENSIQYDLDWSNIRLGNLLNVRVICNNPFETDTEKVAELVRTILYADSTLLFDAVAADKRDDGIIQNDVFGTKARGALRPDHSCLFSRSRKDALAAHRLLAGVG